MTDIPPAETVDSGEPGLSPEEAAAKLTQLRAAATKEYSLKSYATAADLYSEATALQALVSGEMAPSNAELLYAYGRCLYHVAISKSDVLGAKVAGGSGEEPKKKKRKVDVAETSAEEKTAEEKTAEEVVAEVVAEKEGGTAEAADKPFFQITGDENWTDSEGDEDEDAAEGEAEEEDEDDFAVAYEVLDLARVLLNKQIEETETTNDDKGKSAATGITGERRAIMERLADTLDLQAEIWLESERFSDAVPDFEAALDLKTKLFPLESSLIAEAHYKLSLALEFASLRRVEAEGEAGDDAGAEQKPAEVDEEMREQAAKHMEEAIASCKLRVERERSAVEQSSGKEADDGQKNIKDVEEMVAEMEQRLVDLRNPAVATNGGPAGGPAGADAIGGILGSILGESVAEQKARIAEATKGANDLSGLVKRKKAPKPAAAPTSAAEPSAKRKLDDVEESPSATNGKKVKFEGEADV